MKNIVKKGKFFLLLFIATSAYGQSIKKLNDPSIVAQHKRMTFESWGDWRPYPKYILGIQTNFAYATVWGMWAPKINRDYKDGEDIRPLKPSGVQNQRFGRGSRKNVVMTRLSMARNCWSRPFANVICRSISCCLPTS